ncbi:MAG: endolytic transglycosylase MltG [Peptostreptococcaceae bacterium]|nr:endolytic transglycosylase MltG [Peptostreptococcaceae bacterium]
MSGKRKTNKIVKFSIAVFIILIIGVIVFKVAMSNAVEPYDSTDSTKVIVTVPMGSSTPQIAAILEKNGIIGNVDNFKLVSKITGNNGKYKAGTYALSPSMNLDEIMKKLQSGISVANMITIPEGYTIEQVVGILDKAGFIDKAVFLYELENGDFKQKFIEFLPEGPNRLEGFLFPETYDIPVNVSEYDIINIMLNQFDKLYTDKYYARASELGLNINEVITIASMIEREAAVNEDRPKVASVIFNRLEQSMPLQFCSTVQYVLGDPKARLSYEDTQVNSEYNTYINAGLPPGPICSPGLESIKAALHPEETEYLYFVVDPDGKRTHQFAKTYDEFLKYKKEYTDSL